MSTTRTEFEIDRNAVRAASRRRLLVRVGIVAVLLALFGAAVNTWVPEKRITLAWTFALTLAAVYAAVEVSALQWARRSAPTMVLRLSARGLELWIGAGHHVIAWRDLRIRRIRESTDGVRAIELESPESGPVTLAGFQHMDELAQALTSNIAQVRADVRGP